MTVGVGVGVGVAVVMITAGHRTISGQLWQLSVQLCL